MALPRIGFNEGSLLRRTLLHVGTFVVGAIAFIGLMSLVLVTITTKLVSPAKSADASAEDDDPAAAAAAGSPTSDKPSTRPTKTTSTRPVRKRPSTTIKVTEKPADE